MPYEAAGLITLLLWVYCLIDVITAPEAGIRHLPKVAWVMIIIFIPTLGGLLWLLLGRPVHETRGPRSTTGFAEYDRPGRYVPADPAADEEFLRGLRERAEQQRAEARRQEQARQQELDRRRERGEQV